MSDLMDLFEGLVSGKIDSGTDQGGRKVHHSALPRWNDTKPVSAGKAETEERLSEFWRLLEQ